MAARGHDMNREQILTKALEVTTQRQQVHGAPENTFVAIAELWSVYLSELFKQELELKDHQAATMMQLMKVARSIKSPENPDNYVDGAGYAACAGELAGQAALQQIVSMGQEIESQIKDWPVEQHGLPTNIQPQHAAIIDIEQEEDRIDWDRLPPNAKYVAKDQKGSIYWYSHKPIQDNHYKAWLVTRRDSMDRGADVGNTGDKAIIPGDWKQSLRKRPK